MQLLRGVVLCFYYRVEGAFGRVQYLMYEVGWGWFLRCLHFNGARILFIFLYLHLFKGLFIGSYRLSKVWSVGVVILFLFIGVSFIGYVLVYSQMRF